MLLLLTRPASLQPSDSASTLVPIAVHRPLGHTLELRLPPLVQCDPSSGPAHRHIRHHSCWEGGTARGLRGKGLKKRGANVCMLFWRRWAGSKGQAQCSSLAGSSAVEHTNRHEDYKEDKQAKHAGQTGLTTSRAKMPNMLQVQVTFPMEAPSSTSREQ